VLLASRFPVQTVVLATIRMLVLAVVLLLGLWAALWGSSSGLGVLVCVVVEVRLLCDRRHVCVTCNTKQRTQQKLSNQVLAHSRLRTKRCNI
jgi:hypothetical protein